MKLSQATREQKLKAAAELDGWTKIIGTDCGLVGFHPMFHDAVCMHIPDYDTEHKAIIRLIQRQGNGVKAQIVQMAMSDLRDCIDDMIALLNATPSQLLDALLIATGKFEL